MNTCVLSPGPADDPAGFHLMARIAAALAPAGSPVSLLVIGQASAQSRLPPGVHAAAIPALPPTAFHAPFEVRRSLAALQHLRKRPPGLIVMPDAGGLGFHVTLARRLGLGFQGTRILALSLGPRAMRAGLDGRLPAGREDLALDHLERCSIAWADAVVSTCSTALDWLEREGWALPAHRCVLPPPPPRSESTSAVPRREREILFVGELRRGDGLPLFVDALRRLPSERLAGWHVSLLGCRGRERWAWDPQPWLGKALPTGLPWQIEAPDLDELGDRLSATKGIVVIPALGPVSEATRLCLARGVPFIGLDRTALAALLPQEGRARLARPEPDGLAAAIDSALQTLPAPVSSVPGAFATPEAWRAFIARLPAPAAAAESKPDGAELSVVLVHRNRPAMLEQALDGLQRQTLEGFEVVLVDDGSDLPEAVAALDALEERFSARGWRILRGTNQGLGAARNRGWRAARGRFVLFHDDDNIALPHQLETMLAGACRSGAGILTCFFAPFEGDAAPPADSTDAGGILAMLGGAVALGVFENCFGDAHALVRREVLEALGGFTEARGLGHEDWEFFARAALAGHEILAVPEVLFRYRVAAGSMIRGRPDLEPDLRHNLSPYEALLPEAVRPALQLGLADTRRLAAMAAALERSDAIAQASRTEAATLTMRLAATRAERDAAEAELAMLGAEAHGMAQAIVASSSFAIGGWIGRLLGRGAEPGSLEQLGPRDEVRRLVGLLGSRRWEATAPLRMARRLLGNR